MDRVFKRMNLLLYSGLFLMLVAWLIYGAVSAPAYIVLMVIGCVSCLGGIIYGKCSLRCPHCGASLLRGARFP